MSTLTVTDITGDSVTGILPRMAAYMYDRLTGGDDTVCQAAIAAAELWVTSRLQAAGITVDFEVSEVREAAILRTLYELYAYGENEATAKDKKAEALGMLRSKYGSSVDDPTKAAAAESAPEAGMPCGSAVAGRTGWTDGNAGSTNIDEY